jgi:hypothetical protein
MKKSLTCRMKDWSVGTALRRERWTGLEESVPEAGKKFSEPEEDVKNLLQT